MTVAAAVGTHRRLYAQRSVNERPRYVNGRRWDGTACAGAPIVTRSPPAVVAAVTAAAAEQRKSQDGGSSAPLLKLYGNVVLGGGSRGSRRNSWDTLAGSSGSAVAVAAAAAAALAAKGLLRGSVGGPTTAGGGCGGDCCSNSGRTGSATRFWPTGGPLQEDSGPASMLLLGALSGGMSLGSTTSGTSLVKLPTGSGSVRDVLSRIQQQQHQHLLSLQEGAQVTTSSSNWSVHTGLASLFDAHLTAALRRNGAVGTFKRALGGPATFSHTSSVTSQMTGHLVGQDGRQDTSFALTSGLMVLNLGSTAGSSAGGGISSGAGVSQLGAATVATAAAGILVSALPPPRNRRATISSISTINSHPESAAGGSAAAVGMQCRCGVDEGEGHRSALAIECSGAPGPTRQHYGYQMSLISDGGASEPLPHGAPVQRQPRAFGERQGVPHQMHQYYRPRLNPHHQLLRDQQQQQQQQQQKESGETSHTQTVQPGVPHSQVTLVNGSAGKAVRCANPSAYEERGSLSLTLGVAVGLHGGGYGGAGANVLMYPLAPPIVAGSLGAGNDAPVGGNGGDVANGHLPSHMPPQLPPQPPPPAVDVLSARAMAAGSLAAGPLSATWLQPPPPPLPPREPRVFIHGDSEMNISQAFPRYSWETEWSPPGRGVEQEDTFTFTGPESSVSRGLCRAALRETGGGPGGSG
ncbi:hypothetical protein Vretifemale_9888 [Volvox reticuliferus]|nr:hypothetical protein Vretifemale_9888 [Volvox reticuliferus]